MPNPSLAKRGLPQFSKIDISTIKASIEKLIIDCRDTAEKLLKQSDYNWHNFVLPLSEVNDRLGEVWSPVSHLNAVKNSTELRQVYQSCLPLLSEFGTWFGQHAGLYKAYLYIKESQQYHDLSLAQKKTIDNSLRGFKLSGVALPADKQQRFGEISTRLSELSSKFSDNVLDATMGWEKHVTDINLLAGLPDSALEAAKLSAQSKDLTGYRFTLEVPSYLPVITYCENAELRKEMHRAFATRASEQGLNAGKWDNSDIMQEIMLLRHELANLLDYPTYADLSLETKMAESPQHVLDFLNNLTSLAKPQAEREFLQLKNFCAEHYNVTELHPWDIGFYSEKQQQHLFSINDEELRPYFPEQQVLSGLFELIKRIFNIRIVEHFDVDTWHKDVRFFDLLDQNDELQGSFYLDLYARENKRGGAWMDNCIDRNLNANGELEKPVAYLICNFNGPIGDKPALFTHSEVTTLFHEFGHGIHHMLTKIDVANVAGINGVPWDGVELPSQFMENWCWEEEALAFISGHYQTGEPLPKDKLTQLIKAKNYNAALAIIRQLEFALFDFKLHHQFELIKPAQIMDILKQVKQQVSVIESADWARAAHSFSHIFAGGYAAGYYSYLWAEVLSSDAYSRFEEEGIFNPTTGQSFLNEILTRGGSEELMVLFKRFRGREPDLDALLRHRGIKN